MTDSPDLTAIRTALTADIPPPDPAAAAAVYRGLSRGRKRRSAHDLRPRVVRIALAAIVVAAVVTLVVSRGGGDQPGPVPLGVPSAEAAVILDRAAQHLADDHPLRGTQARVIRQELVQLVYGRGRHGQSYVYVLPRTLESGYDAHGGWFYEELPDGRPRFANAAARAAYVTQFGPYVPVPPKPRIENHGAANVPDPNFLELTPGQVLALPTQPGALRARLLGTRGRIERPEPRDLADLASRLLVFGPTPPAVRAALAKLLATLPGVRSLGPIQVGGHEGDLLAFPPQPGQPFEQRLAFDRHTGQLLEMIDVLTHQDRKFRFLRAGTVIDATAYSTAIAPTLDTPVHVPAVTPADGPRP